MSATLTPDIDALPFLVRHGGWFWIVFVVLFALVIMAIVAIIRHVKAVLCMRADLAQVLSEVMSSLTEGKGAVAGRWSKDSVTVGDERVALDKGWRVVIGSRGDKIADGADIIVRGELVREASKEPDGHGYRDNAGGWRLKNGEAYATQPRLRARRLSWGIRSVGFVVAFFASLLTLRIVGGGINDRIAKRDYRTADGQPLHIGEFDLISIAAALPGTRAKALDELKEALHVHPYRDDASVRRELGLALLVDGACADLYILHARPEQQLTWAKRCGYRKTVFNLQVSLGLYDEAWNNRPRGLDAPRRLGMLAIATGHWLEAAEQADEMAAWDESRASERSDIAKMVRADAHRFRCLAQWFRTLGGEPGGAEKLRQIADAPGNPLVICAPIVSETLPVSERVPYLRKALAASDTNEDYSLQFAGSLQALWLAGDGSRAPFFDPLGMGQGVGDGDFVVHAWLYQFGLDTWQERNDVHGQVLALGGILLREVHRGDFAAARRALEEAERLAQAQNDERSLVTIHEWSEYLGIREGLLDLPAPSDADTYMDVLKLRRGEAPQNRLAAFPESCEESLAYAVAAAQQGDGQPLATVIRTCHVFSTFADRAFLGVLPRVKQGRSALAEALRWDDSDVPDSYEPFSTIAYAASHRDIARFIGDNETAERWGDVAKRLTHPLEDRTRTLALVLWDE